MTTAELPVTPLSSTSRIACEGLAMSKRQRLWILVLATIAVAAFNTLATAEENAVTIQWVQHYGHARRISGESQRPVLLFLTTESCIHCLRMEHGTFQDSRVAATILDSFVPARLKLNEESALARDLKVTVYPTTVMIAPDGRILDYVRGYVDTEVLRERMAIAIHKDNTIAAKVN